VGWRYEFHAGRWTKVPYQPDGRHARSTDPSTWSSFEDVQIAYDTRSFDGVGVVLDGSDGLVGWDFDHCLGVDGAITVPEVGDYVHQLDSYTEVTPSGTGLRVFVNASLPPGGRKRGNSECYDNARYLTLTGWHFDGTPRTIEPRQEAVDAVHAAVFAERNGKPEQEEREQQEHDTNDVSDEELLKRACWARNGADFVGLYYRGDISGFPSQSEADLALCSMLAFWTGRDAVRVDRLFRSSALMRDKWERTDYRERTIAAAIAGCRESWSGPQEEQAGASAADDEWHEVIPLEDWVLPEIPTLRPEWLENMVQAVAEATETPRDLAALMMLGTAAAAVQGKFLVQATPGYFEPLNIWVCPALDSGNRKTAVLNHAVRPLQNFESEEFKKLQPEIVAAKSKRATVEAQIDSLRRKRCAPEDIDTRITEVKDLEAKLPTVPHSLQIWTQDTTPEKLGVTMAENDERLAIVSDEGGIFETLGGRYSGGVSNLDLCLKAHAGSPSKVDRINRPSVFMEHPALTLVLSPQPEVLRNLIKKHPEFRGQGLLARFLYDLSPSRLGQRTGQSVPVPDHAAKQYSQAICKMLEWPRGETPTILHFSHEARAEYHEFWSAVEKDMADGGRFELIRDWAGKFPGAMVRIAGVIHCCLHAFEAPAAKKVSGPTMKLARVIGEVLSEHARVTFDLMGEDATLTAARKVWTWIARQKKRSFKFRDCFQALRGSYHRVDDLNPAFEVLTERGYLAPGSREERPGRPSRLYLVNPSLTKEWPS
jgi:hypothetical protein